MQGNQYPSNTIRIAIVDNQELFREGIINLLNNRDELEFIYSSSSEGDLMNFLTTTTVDLVIIGFNNQLYKVCNFIKGLKLNFKGIKVLVLSSIKGEYAILQLLMAGINSYIDKNSTAAELKAVIKGVYSHDFFHTKSITSNLQRLIVDKSLRNTVNLSATESAFLTLVTKDITYKEIASAIKVSEKVISNCRENLFNKFNVKSKAGLIAHIFQNGINE
jgi:DNA-binding NarL/FixJ family response regulator